MKVVVDTTFNGPLKGLLLGTRYDTIFGREEAVVKATSTAGPWHKGETYEFSMGDIFTSVTRSGINTINYRGRPKWDEVPFLGNIEYRIPDGSIQERHLARVRVTPIEVINTGE